MCFCAKEVEGGGPYCFDGPAACVWEGEGFLIFRCRASGRGTVERVGGSTIDSVIPAMEFDESSILRTSA